MNLLSGSLAVDVVLRDHLSLLTGDWWESPSVGNEILDLLQDARETDHHIADALSGLANANPLTSSFYHPLITQESN